MTYPSILDTICLAEKPDLASEIPFPWGFREECIAQVFRFFDHPEGSLLPSDTALEVPFVLSATVSSSRKAFSSDREFSRQIAVERERERTMENATMEDLVNGMGSPYRASRLGYMWSLGLKARLRRLCDSYTKGIAQRHFGFVPKNDRLDFRRMRDSHPECLLIEAPLEFWLSQLILERMVRPPEPSLAESMWSLIQRGFLPLVWRGRWPDGYALVHRPSWRPDLVVPPGCVPTAAQIEAGGGLPGQRKPRTAAVRPWRAPADRPAIAPVKTSTWAHLTDDRDPDRTRLTAHLARLLPGGEPDRLPPAVAARLARIIARVRRVSVVDEPDQGPRLRLDFATPSRAHPDLRTLIGRTPTEPRSEWWTLAPPWTGSIAAFPDAAARVARIHNGMELSNGGRWFRYDGKRSVLEWDAWHVADPDDPDEPFPRQPLIPIGSPYELLIYHPTQRDASGQPLLCTMNADDGAVDNAPRPDPMRVFLRWVDQMVAAANQDLDQVIDEED